MNFYLTVIAAIGIFIAGWFSAIAHTEKETTRAIQEAQARFTSLKTQQDHERQALEKRIDTDRQIAESRLHKALTENAQLRAEANTLVDSEWLIFARLCDSAEECNVLYGRNTRGATSPRYSAITAYEIYQLLAILDEQTLERNLQMTQLKDQLKSCHL